MGIFGNNEELLQAIKNLGSQIFQLSEIQKNDTIRLQKEIEEIKNAPVVFDTSNIDERIDEAILNSVENAENIEVIRDEVLKLVEVVRRISIKNDASNYNLAEQIRIKNEIPVQKENPPVYTPENQIDEIAQEVKKVKRGRPSKENDEDEPELNSEGTAFCFKCKKNRYIKNPTVDVNMIRGTCPKCKNKLVRRARRSKNDED